MINMSVAHLKIVACFETQVLACGIADYFHQGGWRNRRASVQVTSTPITY